MNDPQTPQTPPERKVRLARLSGKETAFWLIAFLALIAFLIPPIFRLPLWINFEIVLAAWWLLWLIILARLLYTGQRISADHQLSAPRNWFGGAAKPKEKGSQEKSKPNNSSGGWWSFIDLGGGDGEGCMIVIGVLVALVLFVALVWFVIEIAIPVILFLLYVTVRGMLAHVINDRHRCRGRLGRSLGWALIWATVYTAPLAGIVWLVHAIHSRQAAG